MTRKRYPQTGLSSLLALTLCLALIGCTNPAGRPHAANPRLATHPSSTKQSLDEQAEAARAQAEKAAQRLLGLAVIPAGAVSLATAPAALPGPALGLPSGKTYVNLARYYRVPMPDPQLVAFLKAHPPAGLTQSGCSGSNVGSTTMSTGLAWIGPDLGDPSSSGQLSVVVAAADAGASYLRLDAGHYWLDPHPIKFVATGPLLRVETGGSCPGSDRGIAGVRNSGDADELGRLLAPPQAATGGLICSYAGGNASSPFSLQGRRVLSAAQALRAGQLAHAVVLSNDGGAPRHCAMDDVTAQLLVLGYPNRPAVDLWLHRRGCAWASNGVVMAGGSDSLQALFDEVDLLRR